MVKKPNILYLHSHDTGRFIQPYGHQVPTPNIQRLADQGLLFRKAFCAAPTCSGSRSALLTGQFPHTNGMMGLAHRGFELHDYSPPPRAHAARGRLLVGAGRRAAPLARPGACSGYDHVRRHHAPRTWRRVAPAAVNLIWTGCPTSRGSCRSASSRPTASTSSRPRCATRCTRSRPTTCPTRPRRGATWPPTRRARGRWTRASATVLNALDEHDLADDTLVIFTTDHGLAFPNAKGTLYDRGIGVLLIMRGPGGAHGGRVSNALVSQVDIFPTICDLAGIPAPERLQGHVAAAGDGPRGGGGQRRRVRRADLPRRLRAGAGGADHALEVHPPLRRPPAPGAPQRRRQPDQGPAAPVRLGRSRAAARGAARPGASTPSRRTT